MRAFITFTTGMLRSPLPVKLWMVLLLAVNLLVPLVYLARPEGQVVLAAMMASAALMVMITARVGFTRLVGLGHIVWVPLLWYLWGSLVEHPASTAFGLWLRAVIVLNAISLVIDVIDVTRYMKGDRDRLVAGV